MEFQSSERFSDRLIKSVEIKLYRTERGIFNETRMKIRDSINKYLVRLRKHRRLFDIITRAEACLVFVSAARVIRGISKSVLLCARVVE